MSLGRPETTPIIRFEQSYTPDPNTGCWLWTKFIHKSGYAAFSVKSRSISAHKFSYLYFKGQIPKGWQVDHKCKCKTCVNPEHLEAVSPQENVIRSTLIQAIKTKAQNRKFCAKGLHEWIPSNIREKKGKKNCYPCLKAGWKRYQKEGRLTPKNHCRNGHEYTKESVYISPINGEKCCKLCRKARWKRFSEKQILN